MGEVSHDHLVLIQIDGMHCHRCEQAIQRAIGMLAGVREVEVDFLSGQASVLVERGTTQAHAMLDAINQAGYRATGFVERDVEGG
jgi:copper chaperone CopZ